MAAETIARTNALNRGELSPLAAWLASAVAATRVEIRSASRLSGGAVQENWRLDVAVADGPLAGDHAWVVRTDAIARIAVSLDRAAEFKVLEAAHAAGVKVARPIARCADAGIIGSPFLVQAFVTGHAQARRLVRDPELPRYGEALAGELGAALARIHTITPETAPTLGILPLPLRPPARAAVEMLRKALDGASEPRPALEHILVWLDAHAPERRPLALVHGDYRTGNYLVDGGRLAAVLDWEFAHWGDPHEDLGWFTARCWRFGADDREAGGIGLRRAAYDGYNAVAAEPLDETVVGYWEVMAAAKWAAIAVLQGDRFRTGGEASIELALTGLMPAEMELDALDLIADIARKGGRTWR